MSLVRSVFWALSEAKSTLGVFNRLLLDRQAHFKVLIVVTLLTATIEAVGIALLMPLIAVLQGQQGVSFAVVGVAVEFDESVAFYAVLVLGAFLLKSGLLLLRIRSALNLTNRLWRRWVMLIVDRQLYAPVRVVGMTDSGQAVATGLGETRACARALLNLQQLIAGLATFFCVYVVLWLSSWRATIGATLLIAAVGALCLRPMARLAHAAGVRQVAALKKASSQLIEIVGGHRDIRAYGTEDYFVTRIGEPLRELESSYTTTHWLASIVHPLVEVVMVGGFCATIIVLSPTAIDLSTSLPLLGVFAAAAFRLFPVTSALSAQWLALISKRPSALRVLDAIRDDERESPGKVAITSFPQQIAFENVSFSYGERGEVLDDVSFTVRKGEKIAVVGASGAGKSTIVSLLMGFLEPTKGTIRIDGKPIASFEKPSWRSHIGFVGQDSLVFQTDVEENISLGRLPRGDGRIVQAAKVAGLQEIFDSLPEGYSTRVGERGLELSGGQRQRVALARALLMRPPLLLLDEAMSSLDNESVARMMEDIEAFQPDATWVVVAHRLHAIRAFDTILVFRDGRLVEKGSDPDLVARGGYYAQLVASEMGEESTEASVPEG